MSTEISAHKKIVINFVIKFVVISTFLYFMLNRLPSPVIADPVNRWTAWMTAYLLRLFGLSPTVNGVLVSAGGFGIKIIFECSAIFAAILFFSFVMAYPASFKQKATGLIVGIPFLFSANLIRIVFIFLIGMSYPDLFGYAHVYIGQILIILLVLLSSMIWLNSTVSVQTGDKPLSFTARFLVCSGIPFLVWLYLDKSFVYANLYAIKFLAGFFGYGVNIPEKLELYPHTFNTFHFVAYTALVLATKSVAGSKKLKSIITGLAVLSISYFLFKLHQILFLDFHVKYAFIPFIALIIINQWILPFGLWLFLVRKEIFKRKGIYTCPICGKEVLGIMDHIRDKHGKDAINIMHMKVLMEDIKN